jgi:hypothetical protein
MSFFVSSQRIAPQAALFPFAGVRHLSLVLTLSSSGRSESQGPHRQWQGGWGRADRGWGAIWRWNSGERRWYAVSLQQTSAMVFEVQWRCGWKGDRGVQDPAQARRKPGNMQGSKVLTHLSQRLSRTPDLQRCPGCTRVAGVVPCWHQQFRCWYHAVRRSLFGMSWQGGRRASSVQGSSVRKWGFVSRGAWCQRRAGLLGLRGGQWSAAGTTVSSSFEHRGQPQTATAYQDVPNPFPRAA